MAPRGLYRELLLLFLDQKKAGLEKRMSQRWYLVVGCGMVRSALSDTLMPLASEEPPGQGGLENPSLLICGSKTACMTQVHLFLGAFCVETGDVKIC